MTLSAQARSAISSNSASHCIKEDPCARARHGRSRGRRRRDTTVFHKVGVRAKGRRGGRHACRRSDFPDTLLIQVEQGRDAVVQKCGFDECGLDVQAGHEHGTIPIIALPHDGNQGADDLKWLPARGQKIRARPSGASSRGRRPSTTTTCKKRCTPRAFDRPVTQDDLSAAMDLSASRRMSKMDRMCAKSPRT